MSAFNLRNWFMALCAVGLTAGAAAQPGGYPSRSIELVVPWQAGGGADVVARAFAVAAQKHLPQSIVVINKPGASGVLGMTDVWKAKPDGYRLLLASSEMTFLNHLGLAKFSYEDFAPIARLNADPATVAVRADAPYATLEEFLEAARKPGSNIRVGNAGHGSTWHMAAVALADKTRAAFNHIPYAGGAPAILALLGGHIDAVTVSTAEVSSHVATGKLKVLAVMADRRVKGFESVPTLKERGIDVSLGIWRGLAAPKDTPPEVLKVLRAVVAKTVQEPTLREALEKLNYSTDTYADDVTLQAVMARESLYFKQLAGKIEIKP